MVISATFFLFILEEERAILSRCIPCRCLSGDSGRYAQSFGDTNAAHISVKDGKYSIDQIFDGETVEEVLDYVQYNPKKLVRQLEQWVTKSVKEGKISLDEGKEFLGTYRNGLFGYTYLQ